MGMKRRNVADPLNDRLDKVIALLQDLIILEGVKEGVNKEDLRGVVGVDKARVNRISKLVTAARKKSGS